jgi:predicted GIY-YIG superfamily endonuclease
MKYEVYVLKNKHKHYIGITKDFTFRYKQHIRGDCATTARLGKLSDLKIIHKWIAPNYILASKLERFCHIIQKQKGETAITNFIKKMSIYSESDQDLINNLILSTPYEIKKSKRP